MSELHCCKPGCDKKAEYELRDGPKIDDYTHSCLEHIPDLMTDAEVHTITKLADEARKLKRR